MLRIRLSRTGKKNHPHYAIVVTEKTNPASDGNFVEKLGSYSPIGDNPTLTFDKDRLQHWISVGAQPTETMARLFKNEGVDGMDKFYDTKKQYKKKPKKEAPEEAAAPAPAPAADAGEAEAAPVEEAPAEATAEEAAPAEEAPAEEAPAEEPAAEEAPAEEPKADEAA